jgi:HEAT repeat protein
MNFTPPRGDGFYRAVASAVFLLLIATHAGNRAVAQTPDQRSWDILNPAVTDTNIEKREQAVTALGIITTRDAHARELVIKALSDEKPEVRTAAANAMGTMGDRESVPALRKALNDPDVGVVLAAAHSLYLLKDREAYEVYYAVLTGKRKSGAGLFSDQRKMLDDPRKMAQFGFETGVGFIPFGGLGLTAVRAITKDDSSPVRAAAAKTLANDPDPKTSEALVTAASDKSWVVRAAALDAISRRGNPDLIVKIVPQLDDEKPVVQYVAAAAIIRLSETTPPVKHTRRAVPAKPPAAH